MKRKTLSMIKMKQSKHCWNCRWISNTSCSSKTCASLIRRLRTNKANTSIITPRILQQPSHLRREKWWDSRKNLQISPQLFPSTTQIQFSFAATMTELTWWNAWLWVQKALPTRMERSFSMCTLEMIIRMDLPNAISRQQAQGKSDLIQICIHAGKCASRC